MNEPRIFFIFALPRSRTSWLANLFTSGPSFCHHEALRDCERVSDLANVFMNTLPPRIPSPLPGGEGQGEGGIVHLGNSDSCLLHFGPELLELFPQAQAAFVLRPRHEVIDATYKFLTEQPYLGQPKFNRVQIVDDICAADRALDAAMSAWPVRQRHTLLYHGLETELCCETLWKFLLPELPWNQRRWQMLDQMRIEPYPLKTRIDWVRAARLMSTRGQAQSQIANQKSKITTCLSPA